MRLTGFIMAGVSVLASSVALAQSASSTAGEDDGEILVTADRRAANPVMPGEIGRWMQAAVPGSELVELAEAGHSPFWDDAPGFAAAVADFAARV
jgi:pimeloyl-ACP methyl ester carboxylesterase